LAASPALAHTHRSYWPAGSDPKTNYAAPHPCFTNSKSCINAGVYYLDTARKRLGQPAYKLPANFAGLSPGKQAFILTNLDRIQYHLPAIPGLTQTLDRDALVTGVDAGGDPRSTASQAPAYTANWAGPFPNLVFAYEAWMYDDGYGSPNLDCTSRHATGCWGHRHDILWNFGGGYFGTGPMAMGAAAVQGRGYATLIVRGTGNYHPRYVYTWKQAKADGAGTHSYFVSKPS
jgi:hypothetical protein